MIIVVIPAHNEGPVISGVIESARRYCDKIVVVADGCTDETAYVAARSGVEVIATGWPPSGCGAATKLGIAKAIDLGADIVVTLDGDGQHDASYLPALVDRIQYDARDLVIGRRVGIGIRRFRILACWLFDLLTGAGIGIDSQSGFKAMTRATASRMLDLQGRGYSVCSEMLMLAGRYRLKVASTPVPAINTRHSLTKPHRQQWFHVPRLAWQIIKLRARLD